MRVIVFAILLVAASPVFAGTKIAPYSFKADNGTVVQAQWGKFQVPLHHDDPDGPRLTLDFVRFPSTNPHPGNPIVYLAGGPGGSGISAARGKRFALFMALRKVADVIALDQRGTGTSNTIPECTGSKLSSLVLTRDKLMPYMASAIDRCVDFWHRHGVDLSAYNTRENALDLESLRNALGAKKLDLWGISYGSQLALAALKVMPEHLGGVVLASPLAPYQTMRLPGHTQDFLARVAALVKADPKVGHVYPDLLGTMKTVLDRKPVRVTVQVSKDSRPVSVTLGAFELQAMTVGMLKDPDMLRKLPVFYYALAAGHYRPMVKRIYPYLSRPITLSGMEVAVKAASCLSPQRARQIDEQTRHTLLGNALNTFSDLIRHRVGVERLDSDFCKPVRSDVPALVLTGTLDGRTYLQGHAEILKGLSHGSEVVIENAGHDLFMVSPKVTTDLVQFFRGKPVPYTHIRIPPPDFVAPRAPRPGA